MYDFCKSLVLLLLLANVLDAQNIFIHWDRISDGVLFPRIDGIDPFPDHSVPKEDFLEVSQSVQAQNQTVEQFQSFLEYNGFINTSHPTVNNLTIREINSILKREKITCRACSEKRDFLDAIRGHLNSLSIRSLKNFLVVRGLSCEDCKSKDELIQRALAGAHLAYLNITALPLFILEGCWLYPRSSLKLIVFEPRYQFMLDFVMRRDQRFGLLPTAEYGIVARIQSISTENDGKILVEIFGEHRFKVESTWEMENSRGLKVANCTLFTDAPVMTKKVADLKALEKTARREFFRHDSDAKASLRQLTLLGNPPPENLGSETFSHWLAMASEIETNKKEMFITTSTQRRLKLGYESLVESLSASRRASNGGAGRHGSSKKESVHTRQKSADRNQDTKRQTFRPGEASEANAAPQGKDPGGKSSPEKKFSAQCKAKNADKEMSSADKGRSASQKIPNEDKSAKGGDSQERTASKKAQSGSSGQRPATTTKKNKEA